MTSDSIRKSIAGTDILYSEELENLQRLLHFPEEVALRLTETEYDLFYGVPPISYVRHVTTDLRAQNAPTEDPKPDTVAQLIKRFNEVLIHLSEKSLPRS